jgi:hypothetical protein
MARRRLRQLLGIAGVVTAVAMPAQAQSESPQLPAAPDALPGFYRVPVTAAAEKSLTVAATGGYGYTASVAGEDGAHHRLFGSLAGGWVP